MTSNISSSLSMCLIFVMGGIEYLTYINRLEQCPIHNVKEIFLVITNFPLSSLLLSTPTCNGLSSVFA